MKISVIFVHYNAQELIEKSILSVWKSSNEFEYEFLICDNSLNFVNNPVLSEVKNLTVSTLGFNAGFSKGVNNGLKKATGDYILILNQDATLIDKKTFKELIFRTNNLSEQTIFGCNLIDENHNYQKSIWLDNPCIRREIKNGPFYSKLYPDWKKSFEQETKTIHSTEGYVSRINGAFLFLKMPKKIDQILFDEDFFLYGEDIEWALRIKKIGYQFYHVPSIKVLHLGSASTDNVWLRTLQIIISDWLMVKKYKGSFYLIILFLIEFINQLANIFLLQFALLRGKKIETETILYTKRISKLYFYALGKYGVKIVRKKHFYKNNEFVLNAYKNDKGFAKQIQNLEKIQ